MKTRKNVGSSAPSCVTFFAVMVACLRLITAVVQTLAYSCVHPRCKSTMVHYSGTQIFQAVLNRFCNVVQPYSKNMLLLL